jgi:hypothetical protein
VAEQHEEGRVADHLEDDRGDPAGQKAGALGAHGRWVGAGRQRDVPPDAGGGIDDGHLVDTDVDADGARVVATPGHPRRRGPDGAANGGVSQRLLARNGTTRT